MLLDNKRVITFATNKSYQNYATVLVKSLRKVFNGLIVCRCVNCDSNFINFLSDNKVIVIEDNVNLNKRKKFKNLIDKPILNKGSFYKGCMCTDEIAYTCHSRFYNAKYIIDNYNPTSLILLDCDFIVNKNFDELFNLVEDILIMDSVRFQHEDCIVIKNTINSRLFIDNIISVLEEDIYFWDQDTLALKIAYEKTPNLKIGELELRYKDFNLNDDSPIWSGDGHAKYNEKFIKKYNEILLS